MDVSTSKTQGALTFDLAKIPQTAVFRTPQSGDVFTKFGGGTKPLNKYLIDKKIPQRQRQNLVVVADGNNVLIVCGVEISNQVKTDQTSQTYYIKQQGEQGNATQQ
ncbi:MAG: tRNA lysidine(34) synthetase TilS [Clostridia bacterium]|nr:tRNA lysidine(34) synthetase TilS [Clostridia bacterium]